MRRGRRSVPYGQARDTPAGSHAARARPVLEAPTSRGVLTRIAHEILERTKGADDVVLLGIPTRGVHLARRLADQLARSTGREVPVGSLDITMYRDDLRMHPPVRWRAPRSPAAASTASWSSSSTTCSSPAAPSAPPSTRSSDIGRPRAVQLAVLVDRGHRELPIRADYVGKNLPTSLRETVKVQLAEEDGRDAVLLGVKQTAQRQHAHVRPPTPAHGPYRRRPRLPACLNCLTEPDRCSVTSSRPPTSPATTPS